MLEELSHKSKLDFNESSPDARPRVAICVGDVAGVGPELALRCAADLGVISRCQPIIVGPVDALRRVAAELPLGAANGVDLTQYVEHHAKDWINIGNLQAKSVVPGTFTAATGQASYDAVNWAIDAAMAGEVAAVVTGPIQKEAWRDAGICFPGHTELIAKRTGDDDVRMMLTADAISCVLVTIHLPLADVPGALSIAGIVRSIHLGGEALSKRVCGNVRVTVLGLNPHAGENGLMSHGEEQEIIFPAIMAARREGLEIVGPVPPDTAFTPSMRERTDVYVCMYHDQGLIPLKAIAFDDAVNVTLGSRIVRTSVDHGTAMDIAWQGIAKHTSMLAAIDMAVDLSSNTYRP